MLFNSYIFVLFFLPLCLFGYYVLNHFQRYSLAEYFLIIMSLWFYAYFNISYLPIILGSIIFNFLLVKKMMSMSKKKWRIVLLSIGCACNAGILFYYKYMGFFVENINILFKTDFTISKILLPLGISFFTFQQLSYVADAYMHRVREYSFREYSLFVSFFPQLIAGPIVLHNETIPQFADLRKRKWNWDNFAVGITAFSIGMAKKVLIADTFGNAVNYGFSNVSNLGSTNAIFVMLAYTIQIYFDFSGYCDMATGIAKMFNIDIAMNFNSPYKALSVTEFWKRWHITLTRFLRTYIYFPLGGNRKGKIRTYINLFVVFLISGIWHGANYTFIIWGMLHGAVMIFERAFKGKIEKLHPALSWLLTFSFINFTWIIFRAENIGQAVLFIKQILKFKFTALSAGMINTLGTTGLVYAFKHLGKVGAYLLTTYPVYLVFGAVFIVLFCKNTNERINSFKPTISNMAISSFLLIYSIISLASVSTFLYFNF